MKLVLCCPNCGNTEWMEETTKDGAFMCNACKEASFAEEMTTRFTESFEDAYDLDDSVVVLDYAPIPGFGITDIVWDTDDEENADDLPKKVYIVANDLLNSDEPVSVLDDNDLLGERIADYLSNNYFFCVKSFHIKK